LSGFVDALGGGDGGPAEFLDDNAHGGSRFQVFEGQQFRGNWGGTQRGGGEFRISESVNSE
jgi:hypothetical protein